MQTLWRRCCRVVDLKHPHVDEGEFAMLPTEEKFGPHFRKRNGNLLLDTRVLAIGLSAFDRLRGSFRTFRPLFVFLPILSGGW